MNDTGRLYQPQSVWAHLDRVIPKLPKMAALAVVFVIGAIEASAQISYFTDFRAVPVLTAINGQDGWTSSSDQMDIGRTGLGWYSVNWAWYGHTEPGSTQNFLIRGYPFSQQGRDWATLHLTSAAPLHTLNVSFVYLLQAYENGRVEISGDNQNWIDVTEDFNIQARFSNDVTWPAAADLSSSLSVAGITTDLYIRFSAWSPSGSAEWHWFAISDLIVVGATTPSLFDSMQSQITDLQTQLESALSANQTLQNTNAQLTADKLSLHSQLNIALQANQSLQDSNTQLAAEKQSLQVQLDAALSANQTLQNANAQLTADNQSLQSQLNVALQANQSLQGTNAQLADEKQSLQSQLDAANALITTLQASITASDQNIDQISEYFATTFGNTSFVIPGSDPAAQIQNLLTAIQKLNHGQLQALYQDLGGTK